MKPIAPKMKSKLRQLYKAVESSATAVIITDSTGVIEYVNPQFVQMMGYTPTEIIGPHARGNDQSRSAADQL